jgi:hypothetical protein
MRKMPEHTHIGYTTGCLIMMIRLPPEDVDLRHYCGSRPADYCDKPLPHGRLQHCVTPKLLWRAVSLTADCPAVTTRVRKLREVPGVTAGL